MSRLVMSLQFARAAGTDAGNRSMRKAGRKIWNEDDYNVAVAEFARLCPRRDETKEHERTKEKLCDL